MTQIILTGPTLDRELRVANISYPRQLIDRIIEVLRAHDPNAKLVPISVTDTQFKLELAERTVPVGCPAVALGYAAGSNLYTTISNYVDTRGTIPQKIAWASVNKDRANPMAAGIGQLFNYDTAALDDLWIASKLR
jgi:hypothetical protein